MDNMKHESSLFKWAMGQKLRRFKFNEIILPVGFKRMHRIVRWNAIVPTGLERSVFEHSIAVTLMAVELGLSEDAVLKATLHDALEVYSGDIQTRFKLFIPEYDKVERAFFAAHAEQIRNDFFNTHDKFYLETWKDEEGRWLKFLDHLDGWLEAEDMMFHGVKHEQFERYRDFLVEEYPWIAERFEIVEANDAV
jgi:5'-deoxynucleotidase YfbR-like HD superfamily hydrolase